MDFAALISDAGNSISVGMGDLLNQGGNAALGYLEGQAISAISADQKQHQDAAQASIAASLAKPGSTGDFGSYLKNLISTPILQQKGPQIMLLIVGLGIAGYFLLKR